jgi:hypothetical protein
MIQSSRAQLCFVILTYTRMPIVMKASRPVVRTVAVRLGPRSCSEVSFGNGVSPQSSAPHVASFSEVDE